MATFPSIRIEGGLLGPDVLDQLLAGDLSGQKPADFGLESRRSLTDEIAGIYADARSQWGIFQHRLQKLKPDDLATSVTRDAWLVPFLGLLGHEPTLNARAHEVDGLSFFISHRAGSAENTPPIHLVGARQELGRVPASGRPRLAPHSLVQEYLNRTEHVWGIVTNGLTLRLLRDCTFVRRQAYVEFDLQAMLEEQRFQDFAVLYRLLHRTRFPKGLDDGAECLLEKYYAHSIEQGGRVRDRLRDGVEDCLQILGNGFFRHSANGELRRRVSPRCTGNERLSPEQVYRELLRLVYRFLFLLVSEDRGLLSADPIYREHYSIARIRRLVDHRAAYTDHDDLWQTLRVLWKLLIRDDLATDGKPLAAMLGLPVLNGELFAPQDLDDCSISNRNLLEAFWRLAWYQETPSSPPRRVNYAALDVEELGSVYESLLEFHPTIDVDSLGRFTFQLVIGSERKTTGSYYTPPELVGELIKSALEPVIAERIKVPPTKQAKALLSIRVCDPACGSGHFLLAAARRIGKELARVRTGEDEPAPERVREAIRDVISHCIYGVDKNPLAVDLCRVALWLESHTSDKPLTFLDHRIRNGDSLIGVFNLDVLKDGIPEKAFEPLEGDDKPTARDLKKRNKQELAGYRNLFDTAIAEGAGLADFTRHSRELDEIADDSPELIRRKKKLFESSHADPQWRKEKLACDLWTAAFFQPLTPGAGTSGSPLVITSGALLDHLSGQRQVPPQVMARAETIAWRQRIFHWPLEFPEVFADGGFDVILSNPPWERVKLQEQEFFAARDARIANAANKAARTQLIKKLPETNPELHREFTEALRSASAGSAFMRHGQRYPLAGRGDINTYAVFAELATAGTNPKGRAGLIVPTGIATDDTTKVLFGSFVENGRLVDLVGFENEDFIFQAVHHAFKFCKITIGGTNSVERSRIAFYIRKFGQLADEHRFFSLEPRDFSLLNPNTGNCPIFRTQADAELTKAIYRRVPVLWKEATETEPEVNPWRLSFCRLFDMSNDSHLFKTEEKLRQDGYRFHGNVFKKGTERYQPLYEAKMLHQFDHRFSTYEGATESQLNVGILPQPSTEQKCDPNFVVQPRYWVKEEEVEKALPKYPKMLADALAANDREAVQHCLACWSAGYYQSQKNEKSAALMLESARGYGPGQLAIKETAEDLQRDFPLTEADVKAIAKKINEPEALSMELIERFSPKWLMEWRDITNAGNERTLIASASPMMAVGNNFPLFFMEGVDPHSRLAFESMADAFVVDYIARQKVGGTHINYFYLKQFPFKTPNELRAARIGNQTATDWLFPRILELVYTAHDLAPLAKDCGYAGPPFVWDDDRRFEIRCELDAAFFHLYLPCESNGDWRTANGETAEQLTALKKHFPTPRDAVAFIMDQFPIVKQKDEEAHGRYRTKERILEIYDEMLKAQRTGREYESRLNRGPGAVNQSTSAMRL